jgi:hypothetical protein
MSPGLPEIAGFSALVFVLAFTMTTIFHEGGHAVVSRMLGDRPVLYATFVAHGRMSPRAQAVIAAAGPAVSLAQGILFSALFELVSGPTTVRLLLLWTGLLGLAHFFGYLVTTPFVAAGDLGKVARHLGWRTPVRLLVGGLGIATTWVIGALSSSRFLELAASPQAVATSDGRSRHLLAIAVLPWVVGAIVVALSHLPAPHPISLAYPFLIGLFTMVAWHEAKAASPPVRIEGGAWGQIEWWPWLAALLAALLVFRGVLARGVRLGW